MNITTLQEAGQITLKLEGWLDTLGAPELGAAVEAIETAEAVVLDFSGVEYIASSGLRQVVACHRKARELNAEMSVINVCSDVMSIFRMTALDKKLVIHEKTAEAEQAAETEQAEETKQAESEQTV